MSSFFENLLFFSLSQNIVYFLPCFNFKIQESIYLGINWHLNLNKQFMKRAKLSKVEKTHELFQHNPCKQIRTALAAAQNVQTYLTETNENNFKAKSNKHIPDLMAHWVRGQLSVTLEQPVWVATTWDPTCLLHLLGPVCSLLIKATFISAKAGM